MRQLNESHYQRAVVGMLRGGGVDVQVHSERYSSFVPDLSFSGYGIDGWAELKWLNELPETLGKIPHFTLGQENWLMNRGKSGSGHCYLWVGGAYIPHCIIKYDMICRGLPIIEALSLGCVVESELVDAIDKFIEILKRGVK